MLEIKIAVDLGCFRQKFKKSLETAARLGVKAVEVDLRGELKPSEISETGIRHLRKMLEHFDVSVSAATFQTRRGYENLDDLSRRVEATKQAMSFAYELGTNVVINQIGKVPEDRESEQWDTLMQSLSDIGRHAQHSGTFLAARTGTESGAELAAVIEALPRGSLAVDFDPGNLIINGYSASEALQDLAEHVMHFHVRDGVQDLAQGRGIEVPVGRGSADFPSLFGKLEEHHYNGWFSICRTYNENVFAEVADTIEYLRNI